MQDLDRAALGFEHGGQAAVGVQALVESATSQDDSLSRTQSSIIRGETRPGFRIPPVRQFFLPAACVPDITRPTPWTVEKSASRWRSCSVSIACRPEMPRRFQPQPGCKPAGTVVGREPYATDSESKAHGGGFRSSQPSRGAPVLDGGGRLERATRCGAGKSARRFLAASSVSVIRVDLE